MYKVIHNNSADNRRCKAVLVLISKLPKIKKKKINNVFKSPKNKTSIKLKKVHKLEPYQQINQLIVY